MDKPLPAPAERPDDELVDICLQLYARTYAYPDKESLHMAAFEAIAELKKRLRERAEQLRYRPMSELPPESEEVLLSVTDEDDGEEVLYAAAYDHQRKRWIYQGGTYSDDYDVVTFKQKNGWLPMPRMNPPKRENHEEK